jgi:hypothetical protein
MGTEIALSLGGVDLAWSKNRRGMDHGALFQEKDRKAYRCDQVDYRHYEDEGLDPTPMEMAFVRKLGDMVQRLELLGFTLGQARSAYADRVTNWREEREALLEPGDPPLVTPLTFDEFSAVANQYPLAELDGTFMDRATHEFDGLAKGRFADDDSIFARIPGGYDHELIGYSERYYLSSAINILHPYLMLRILAENPVNRATDVVWQYGPLVENGWASVSEFNGNARRAETFLVATEGSSDAHILRHALALMRPEVLDFFRFIDVSERHPFAGTGNLVKFAEGLAKIDVHNQTVFVFDNDAEGVEAFRKVGLLNLPPNMRAILLPDLEAFREFPTKGPQGENLADINGRGAAIECYLDHRLHDYPPPRVIWTNYKREMDAYHGALEHKESYAKAFLDLRPDTYANSGYDTGRISKVLDALIAECVSIAQNEIAATTL